MKKPKKTTAAKPSAAPTVSNQAKAEAKTVKMEPAKAPGKSQAKNVRRTRIKALETVKLESAPEEAKPAAKEESSEEIKGPSPVKPKEKKRSAVTVPPAMETKAPASERVEAKSESAIKPIAKKQRVAVPKATAQPVVETARPVEAKPSRSKVKTAPNIETSQHLPAKVESKAEAQEVKPIGLLKEKTGESRPATASNPVSAAQPAIKLPPAASETKPKAAEAEAPVEKPIAPMFSPPAKRAARKAPEKIPPILLEGDKPEAKVASGPGQRYALGPTAPAEKFQTEGELPESYGTGELLLTARDPHWLYTHWDLSGDQQRRYNAFSRDGHLIVRVYIDETRGKPAVQVHVNPESRHWFVHVEKANTRYLAELGYYSAADKWTVVAKSASTLTPPDAVSTESAAEFGTIPFEVPMGKLLSLVKDAVRENAPLAQALHELRAEGHPDLPRVPVPTERDRVAHTTNGHARGGASGGADAGSKRVSRWTPSEWTPAQERALAEVVSMDHVRRVWMGSLEITELIRRQFMNEVAIAGAAEPGAQAPTSPGGGVTAISSPGAKAARPAKGFWFNVNAELIVYGATEKDATVAIAGRRIKLRPDGSFSYRFALPDGNYEMPIVAVSADHTDGRAAELTFSRSTEYRGDVGQHRQDSELKRMTTETF